MRQLHVFVLALSVFAVGCQCGAKPAAPTQLLEGEACENDERCVTGLCDAAPGFSPVCVRRCGDGCLPTEVCVQLTPNRFACQPDQRKLCQPCAADLDCPYPSDKCLLVNTEKVCGRDCAFDQTCPTGYRCVNGAGADGTAKIQQCVPIVASCACLARGDFEQPCQNVNAEGTCSGLKKCDLVSNSVVCDAREAVTETCNGVDDDCDGDTDEGQMTATCGVGACQRSVDTCVDGGVANCTPGSPITELCNGIDDDCDGVLDNGFDTTTTVTNCGACGRVCMLPNATPRCDVGLCRVLTCNTGFDNCNNLDPDGCETSVTSDPNNCGGCNQACTRPNSTASCSNSTCSFVCAAGWVDLNNDPVDGCEYNCTFTSATDLPDLMFVDANCDGVDGELNNGIFVSPNGLDSNAGTRAAPKLTLGAAMTTVVTNLKRDVYIAEGTYTGPLDLLGANGINVAGAYHPTTWARAFGQQVIVNNGNPGLRVDGSSSVLVQAIRFVGADGTASEPTSYGAKIVESSNVRLESLDIRAGNGLAGASGNSRAQGAGGTLGENGIEGCYNDPRWDPFNNTVEWTACNTSAVHCYWSSARAGGAGGASTCGASGGAGGAPSRYNVPTTSSGQSGIAGNPSGGTAGLGVAVMTTPVLGSQYWGGNGANGGGGSNGNGSTAGTFNSNGYVLSTAAAGTGGTAGRGGGGGGGGAGGLGLPLPGYNGLQCYTFGSPGSGGGSGGCGGQAGSAGLSGGASIGLFLVNSQVAAQGSFIRTGNGGNGGAGGTGGSGGMGAAGGISAYDSKQGAATRGAGGGRGGNGGSGGHGGAGAGGSVYGIVKNMGSQWTPTGGSVTLGTVGAGGTSAGNPGVTGASGVQTTF